MRARRRTRSVSWGLLLFLGVLLSSGSAAPAKEVTAEEQEEARLNELALQVLLEGEERIMRVADRIRIAGAPWCGRKLAPVVGAYAADQFSLEDRYSDDDFIEPFVEAAQERFQLTKNPRVLALVPGGPADAAGLEVGDLITELDERPLKRRLFLDAVRGHEPGEPLHLTVERGGSNRQIAIRAEMGCAYASRFSFGTNINAFATSAGSLTGLYVYAGMLRFLTDDDDLAVIVGHELAHLILGHGAQVTTERTEAAADRLGLFLAARAGFEVERAPRVWDRMSRQNPSSLVDRGFYSHPVSSERAMDLHAVLEEIADRRQSGVALLPGKGNPVPRGKRIEKARVEAHLASLRSDAVAGLRSDQQRIQDVSYRLAVAGTPECGGELAPTLGASVARRQDFGRHKADEVAKTFGVGDEVTVLAVAHGSPGEIAGLQVGDQIREIDGNRIRRSSHVHDRLRSSDADPLALRVRRGDDTLDLQVKREAICPFGVLVVAGGGSNTGVHGNRDDMLIPTGLLRFVRDDDELAIAVAHQMGHQILGSFRRVDDEPRADELGIAIAARAGFDVSKAPAFWDRWASEQFWTISAEIDDGDVPHGAMSQRAPAIRSAVEKEENSQPLVQDASTPSDAGNEAEAR